MLRLYTREMSTKSETEYEQLPYVHLKVEPEEDHLSEKATDIKESTNTSDENLAQLI